MMISKLWEWFTNDTHIPEKPVTPSWMLANPGIRNDNPWQVKISPHLTDSSYEKVTLVASNIDQSQFLHKLCHFLELIPHDYDYERLKQGW